MLTNPQESRLRAERLRCGLSLRETARRAGIEPAHLSRVERCQASLSLAALVRVACVLNLTVLSQELETLISEHGQEVVDDGS